MIYDVIAYIGEKGYNVAKLENYQDACFLAEHLWITGYKTVQVCSIKTGLVCVQYDDSYC